MNIDADVQSAINDLQALLKGDPARPAVLFRLGTTLGFRGAERQSIQDLNDAVEYHCEALELHPAGEVVARRQSLQNIACVFMARFDLQKDSHDLDECVDYFRRARELLRPPQDGPDSFSLLTGFGISLRKRHELTGKLPDIDEAINVHADALDFTPPNHNNRHWAFFCLAQALFARGSRHWRKDDINHAITHHEYAFKLWPTEDKDRYSTLYNVARALITRFDMFKDPTDLDNSISNYEAALGCINNEHPNYTTLRQHHELAVQKRRTLGRRSPSAILPSGSATGSALGEIPSVVQSTAGNQDKLNARVGKSDSQWYVRHYHVDSPQLFP